MVRTGKPYSEASRANALSVASSFFTYLDVVSDAGVKNPFDAVQRPVLDPDYSPTPGYTGQEWTTLVVTARDHHRAAAYRKRAYALLLVLYTCCLRIDSMLNARVEHLGYDKGHHWQRWPSSHGRHPRGRVAGRRSAPSPDGTEVWRSAALPAPRGDAR